MNFYIQAGNPRINDIVDKNDKSLADALESVFPLNTENVIMVWNHINILISYKYDISYMIDDLLKLLCCLQNSEKGKMIIHWLPDTFRCDWAIAWGNGEMEIQSRWECVAGHMEGLLNDNPRIKISVKKFVSEWKEVLEVVINGLRKCGYDEEKIGDMKQLLQQAEKIKGNGILYQQNKDGF